MFIGEEIEVTVDGQGAPLRFAWRDAEYMVQKILSTRVDRRFSKAAPQKKTWRLRHHRNYYRVNPVR